MNNNEQGSRIDFKTLLAQREFNHLRLLKLMPSLHNNDHFQFCYHPVPGHHLQLSLEVTHRAPYTLTVQIRQKANQNKLAITWLQNMKVQLYIDVKATEVIECNEELLLAKRVCCDYEEYIQHLLKKARYDSFLADLLTFWINHAMAPESTLPDQRAKQVSATDKKPVRAFEGPVADKIVLANQREPPFYPSCPLR